MKYCKACRTQCEDAANFCSNCGAREFYTAESVLKEFFSDAAPATGSERETARPEKEGNTKPVGKRRRQIRGVLGAVLLSLIGVLLAFILYQLDTVHSLSAIAMFYCAGIGYELFYGEPKPSAGMRILVSTLVAAVMIYVAEYACVAFENIKLYGGEPYALPFVFRTTAYDMSSSAVVEELLFSYLLGGVNLLLLGFGYLKSKWKAKRQAAGK